MKSIFTPEYDVFCKNMIAARKKSGLTQAMLAQAINKPQSFVAKYENGERRLDVVEFLQISHVIGIDPCEIIRVIEQEIHQTSCEENP